MTTRDLIEREVMDLSSTSDVLPFCVYHSDSKSFISGPSLTKNKDGFRYECAPINDDSPYGKWKHAFTFYAINPMVRPIPYGMSLFCAKRRNTYPWDTVSVETVYDPFDVSDQCIYFITYTKPVPFTTPLYNHIRGEGPLTGSTFASLSPNPPNQLDEKEGKYEKVPDEKNPTTITTYEWKGDASKLYQLDDLAFTGIGDTSTRTWRHNTIFPIYVMSPEVFGDKYENIRFTCHNATCFPHKDDNNYAAEVDVRIAPRMAKTKYPKPRTLSDCAVRCNELVPVETGRGHPFGLLSIIDDEISKFQTEKWENKIAKIPPVAIAVVVGILVVSLSVIIYYAIRSNK